MNLEIATALAKVGRPPILEQFGRRSCIAATRIGLDVFDYFGVRAVPVPLFVLVLNGEALELADAGATQAELQAEMQKYGMDEPGGPWGIGLGAEIENSKDWAGHLMIGMPDEQVLVDLSFDQASRPHKGLPFPEEGQIFPVPDDAWWQQTGRGRATFGGEVGEERLRVGLVFDRNCPDPDGFKRSRNWYRDGGSDGKGRAAFREVTGKIIRLVNDELRNPKPEEAAS